MHQPIDWTDRLEDGTRREVRVFVARQQVKWQFRLEPEDKWDYASSPTAADWDLLLQKMKDRYQRRNISYSDLQLVTRLHQEAQGLA